MKDIYLGEREEPKILFERIVVDRIPPKSTYYDSNASGVVGSKTFVPPDMDELERMFGELEKGSEEQNKEK